jgi:hypothetical protein
MAILSDGQVSNTKEDIYEIGGFDVFPGSSIDVDKITFVNTNSIEQTTILYLKKRNEPDMEIVRFKLLENERGECLEPSEDLGLKNGDAFQAQTTTPDAVNFVVYGKRV